jgi:hypothetical protein
VIPIALRAAVCGIVFTAWLRFGLEPTGWLFYEASHALHADWLYWGYTVFRGGGYLFGLWPYQTLACITAGLVLAAIVFGLGRRRRSA